MAKITNLSRRGAVYWWRRRTRCGGVIIALAVSLRTKDLRVARERAARLGVVFERLRRLHEGGRVVVDSAVVKRVYETALRQALDDYEAQNLMGEFRDGEWTRSHLRVQRTIYEVMAGRRDYPTDDEFRRDGWSQYEIDELGLQEHVELNLEDSPVDAIIDAHFRPDEPRPGLEQYIDRDREGLTRAVYGAWADATAQFEASLRTTSVARTHDAQVAPDVATSPTAPNLSLDRLISALASALPLGGEAPPKIPESWQGATVAQAMRRYIAESAKGRKWSADSKRRALDAASLLDGVTNGKPCYEVERQHLKRLSEVFDELPVNRGKSVRERELSLGDLLALTKARLASGEFGPEDVGLNATTINVRVRDLRGLFEWLRDSEKLPVGHLYWKDLPRSEDRRVDERDKKPAWTEEEARHIFSLPMWTGCVSLTKQGRKRKGDLVIHDAAYWVAPLAWYHGLRREEICKLRLDEVHLDGEIPHLDIGFSSEGSVKSARSVRKVPLHTEVLRLGFADYVAALRGEDEELLFPELRPGESPEGVVPQLTKTGRPKLTRRRGDVFYDIWWLHIMAIAYPAGAPKDIHSFRHAFADAIEEVEAKAANDLLGHKSGELRHDRYGSSTHLERLKAAVERVPVVTGHLERVTTRLLPPKLREPRAVRTPQVRGR